MAKLLPQRSSAIVKYGESAITKKNKSIIANKKTKISSASIVPRSLINPSAIVKQAPPGKLKNQEDKLLSSMENKIVNIDKIFKSSLLTTTKENQKKRESEEKDEFKEREKELEKQKPKKIPGINLPKLPGFGLFDLIKNFIFNTLLGFIAIRLIDHLPKLLKLLPIIFKVGDFIIDIAGKLLNGLVTFIDWGYKAVDSTRGFIKDKFGEDVLKNVDAIGKHLNTFFNLAVIAGLLSVKSGGIGRGSKGGGSAPRPGQGGRPGVTTSGGGRAGGFDVRNPLRQRPNVTTSGGRAAAGGVDLRNPLRQRPKVTTSGGGKSAIGLGSKIGTKGLFIVGPLIDIAIRTLVFNDPLDKAIAGAAGVAAGQALGSWIGGIIGGVAGSVVPVLGNIIGASGGALIGGVLGGFLGDFLGVSLYNFINQNKTTNQLQGGGSPTTTESKQPTRQKGKRTISKKKKARTISFTPKKIRPGASVGGDEKVQSVFPNPDKPKGFLGWLGGLFGGGSQQPEQNQEQEIKKTKSANPQEFLARSNDILGKADFFGPFFTLAYKSVLGDKPNKLDYRNAGMGLNAWMQQTFSTAALGFAGGGEVDASEFFKGEDYTDVISKSVEESVSGGVDTTIRGLAKELAMRPVGKEEMVEENIKRGTEGGGADGTTTGGISGTGITKAISIAKKLMVDLNIKPAAAAGIVGNLMLESGLKPDNVENGKGFEDGAINNIPKGTPRVGYGWGQWTGGRLESFRNFLRSRKSDNRPATDDDNYAYLLKELRGPEPIRGHWKGWGGKNIPEDDPKRAATWFMMNWERPGVPHEDKRHDYAIQVFEKIKGLSREQAKIEVERTGGRIIVGNVGDGRDVPSGPAGAQTSKILAGAKKIIGKGSGVGDQCANTVRDALRVGGHPAADKRTKIGDLDTPKGTTYSAPSFAASFGGSDMGKIIRDRSSIMAGDIILWRDYVGGKYGKGAITHVGIAADNGLKNQYDHNRERGFHYRPHWNKAAGTEWFAGVRLYGAGGETPGQPHLAVLGDGGKPEYVISGDAYEQTEKAVPGLLDVINYGIHDRTTLRKNMPDIIESVNKYASYEEGSQQIIIIEDDIIDNNQMQSSSFSSLVIAANSNIDNSAYETLEML
jgi:hypothetical protein